MDNYIAQRLAAIAAPSNDNNEVEALRAENARLKQQLEQSSPANFKSEAQAAFEQSPEFESILNAFFMRYLREKYGAEFRDSQHVKAFQGVANQAFSDFEKNFKKDVPKNGQTGKKDTKASGTNTGETG